MSESAFHDPNYRVTHGESPVLRRNMIIFKGKFAVAKYHGLYNHITETGELYNPHVHATFIPSQFLHAWNMFFSELRVPTAKHAVYTGLRIAKMILDANTDEKTVTFLKSLDDTGVSEALRFVLSLSKYIDERKPLAEFEEAPTLKAAVHLYSTSLQSMRISVKCSRIHNMTLCYSVIPHAYTQYMKKGPLQTSNHMNRYFHRALPITCNDKRKLAELYQNDMQILHIHDQLCKHTQVLADAYHTFGAYVTLKHFASFSSRYCLSNKLMQAIREQVDLYEAGDLSKEYGVEEVLTCICREMSLEDVQHINSADSYCKRGKNLYNARKNKNHETSYFE